MVPERLDKLTKNINTLDFIQKLGMSKKTAVQLNKLKENLISLRLERSVNEYFK